MQIFLLTQQMKETRLTNSTRYIDKLHDTRCIFDMLKIMILKGGSKY